MSDAAHHDERRHTGDRSGEEPNRVSITSEQHPTLLMIDP
jgi:hypothetical protein